jgi:hypothetical protein
VVFTAEGRPVLTDLGTARLVGDISRAEVTPAYVDPVVARGGAPGPASDVFGVAAAAFHAITGIAPWNAADPRGTLAVAAAGELPDLALLAPEAPAELIRVIRRGLSAEPHQRGSAAAFALDLRHACRPEPVRLPSGDVPDEELGRTGRGPRTELTHQVPGRRRAPAAHAVPVRAGWLAGVRSRLAAGRAVDVGPGLGGAVGGILRRVAVVAGVLGAVAAGVAGAAWAGASWGGAVHPPPVTSTGGSPAGVTALPRPAVGSDAPAGEVPAGDAPAVSSPGGQPGSGDATVPVADRTTVPADDDGWTAVLAELYTRRAAAFAGADPAPLGSVYLAGSALLDRDAGQLGALKDAGEVLAGFSPQVRRVLSVIPDGADRFVVQLIDELPGYRVVPAGTVPATTGQQLPGRGEAQVRIALQRTPAGWRISDAELVT